MTLRGSPTRSLSPAGRFALLAFFGVVAVYPPGSGRWPRVHTQCLRKNR